MHYAPNKPEGPIRAPIDAELIFILICFLGFTSFFLGGCVLVGAGSIRASAGLFVVAIVLILPLVLKAMKYDRQRRYVAKAASSPGQKAK